MRLVLVEKTCNYIIKKELFSLTVVRPLVLVWLEGFMVQRMGMNQNPLFVFLPILCVKKPHSHVLQ